MIKLFFITFFIAELIIAFAVILKLYKLNRCVNSLNEAVLHYQPKIRFSLIDFREAIGKLRENIDFYLNLIQKKRQEYTLRLLKTTLIYLSILLLKGKYKKTVLAYQLISEIYAGIKEADE